MIIINVTITFLCALLGVAFVTLLERNLLSYLQNRNGPNKVGLGGILQPFADALNLFLNSLLIPFTSNKYLFSILPVIGLSISLLLWGLLPSFTVVTTSSLMVILFLCLSSLNVYITIGAGWSSNSVYSFLGSIRASAQSISYEISLVFIILLPCILLCTLDVHNILTSYPFFCCFFFAFLLWLISCFAETNRAPFDFAEGESELVSGFNIEFGGGLFAILFLAEYTSIIFLSMFSAACFINPTSFYLYAVSGILILFLFLLIRGVYPRQRYDKLISLCWNAILPLSIGFLCLVLLVLWL